MNDKPTPMFQQYLLIKEKYPDTLLFFRLGDFYEMFYEDALTASKALDLTLTQRAGAPMCGVPYHASETYIQKLISMNFKVAICEQLSEPKRGQMVERDVIRVVTPGTVTEDIMLDNNRNNFILCAYFDGSKLGLSYSDITTGLFETEQIDSDFVQAFTHALLQAK